jgi:two-component system, cell cycle sensor histidine kinase and response regulator CckA
VTVPIAETRWQILLVEDNAVDAELCVRALGKSGLPVCVDVVATREDFASKLETQPIDIVISDYRLGDWNAIDALDMLRKTRPDTPLILVTGTLGDELAVECIKNGVTDYVLKHQLGRLPLALRRARQETTLRQAEKRAVEALREREEHYRILVENAPEAILVCDVERGRFIDCNAKAANLYGVSRETLLSHGPGDFTPVDPAGGDSKEAADRAYCQALAGGTPSFEYAIRRPDGRNIPCEVHLISLPSSGRRLVRASIIDITERKQAEDALRKSEARYRGLVNNATYGVYWEKPDGALIYANPALVKMLAYHDVDELLAAGNTRALYSDRSKRETVFADYHDRQRIDAVAEWKRKDGRIITVRIQGRRATHAGENDEWIEVMVEDITERIALETQLMQAQKFEAIGQLAGGIAHDFNNMIGAILGWAEMGMDETETGSKLRHYFDKVHLQGQRAASLTRQLLAFARRQILEPRDIDLNQSVPEALSLLEKVIGGNIVIRTSFGADLPLVHADPTQLEQVLMNLCINARDAMPEGGLLAVETSRILFDAEACKLQPLAHPGEYVMLSVTDSGTGMDSATLDRIFEPFFTTKELGKGTGLGLATVYGIVRQHGGFVNVYSEVGMGTTFRVYIPVSAAKAPSPEKRDDSLPVRGGTETLLVVEDHEGLRQLAIETLSKLGYKVIPAIDGEQAVREFSSHQDRIDLALLDLVLPKLNGPEIYNHISAARPDLPVVFATGYSADFAMLHKIQRHGLPVLQKPYTARDLARKVREALDCRTSHAVRS